jgi:hypothetical protein
VEYVQGTEQEANAVVQLLHATVQTQPTPSFEPDIAPLCMTHFSTLATMLDCVHA